MAGCRSQRPSRATWRPRRGAQCTCRESVDGAKPSAWRAPAPVPSPPGRRPRLHVRRTPRPPPTVRQSAAPVPGSATARASTDRGPPGAADRPAARRARPTPGYWPSLVLGPGRGGVYSGLGVSRASESSASNSRRAHPSQNGYRSRTPLDQPAHLTACASSSASRHPHAAQRTVSGTSAMESPPSRNVPTAGNSLRASAAELKSSAAVRSRRRRKVGASDGWAGDGWNGSAGHVGRIEAVQERSGAGVEPTQRGATTPHRF